jgi:hypothetical protein
MKDFMVGFSTNQKILIREGFNELVVKGKLRKAARLSTMAKMKMSIKQTPKNMIFPLWMIRCLFKIVLHFIPFIGPLSLVLIEGPRHGRRCHRRYFELKGFDARQEEGYVRERRGQYMGFGIMAAALESTPIIGLFFAYTNTAGAALWSVAIEKRLAAGVRKKI